MHVEDAKTSMSQGCQILQNTSVVPKHPSVAWCWSVTKFYANLNQNERNNEKHDFLKIKFNFF